MKMVLSIVGFALLTCSVGGLADTSKAEPKSWTRFTAEMRHVYGDESVLTRTVAKGQIGIELCPDNTCVGVVAPRTTTFGTLSDFFYLFEFYVAPYHEQQQQWKPKGEVADYARSLLAAYGERTRCVIGTELEVARCVLRHLEKTQKIGVRIVRYDEEKKIASSVKVDEFFRSDKPGSN